jgi:hypothetical protein
MRDYVGGGLSALLKLIKECGPENQPSGDVLEAFAELLKISQSPSSAQVQELLNRLNEVETNVHAAATAAQIKGGNPSLLGRSRLGRNAQSR